MEIWGIEYVTAAIRKEDPGSGGLGMERVLEGRSRAFTGSHFSHGAGGWGLPKAETWVGMWESIFIYTVDRESSRPAGTAVPAS